MRRIRRLERPGVDIDGMRAELAVLRAGREAEAARALAPGAPPELVQSFLLSMMAHGGGAADRRIAELEWALASPIEKAAAAARQAEIAAMSPTELEALLAERQARPGRPPAG
jgi:hypothetical protein